MAVTFELLPKRALLNDINPHVMNLYRWLKRGLVIDLPMRNNASTYYGYRDRFNALIGRGEEGSKEGAELFYYLNRTGYNGLCRFNGQGKYNVPFGQHGTINYQTDLRGYRKLFKSWEVMSGDFQKVPLNPSDFVYADPPYDVDFTKYAKEDFTWEDQVRLAKWLSKHPGPVVLSNQATRRITSLYRGLGFKLKYLDAPRRISCTGDRTSAREVLATKNL